MARYQWRDRNATHQPVLQAALAATSGPIAEFGGGHGSTPLLHSLAADHGRRVVTLDTNREWLDRFRATMESPCHEFRLVADWDEELARPEWDGDWSVVLVDQQPWEGRAATVLRLAPVAEYCVVHDCDYFARTGMFGREEAPIVDPANTGRRDYGDVFTSWVEYFPPEPWPFPPTGPPTLLGSNQHDVGALTVSYELPFYVPVAARLAKALPTSVKLRISSALRWGELRPLD